tara:strand:- start:2405 stop:3103 length:699 start_codon:yes stop_codon:yes gene_type:complete
MKLILENWREYLNEDEYPVRDPRIRKKLNRLLRVPNAGIAISLESPEDEQPSFAFEYVEIEDFKKKEFRRLNSKWSSTIPLWGMVLIGKNDKNRDGQCYNGWVIVVSEAMKGWGPLLYEVALEWASENGTGLMSDRTIVSNDALVVWGKYAQRLDVDRKQMDVVHGIQGKEYNDDVEQLTPNYYFDDCDQRKAIFRGGKSHWDKTPISKIYSKDIPEVMRILKAEGRLIILT